MKFSQLALLSVLAAPVAADIYFKEQFNDGVRFGLGKTSWPPSSSWR